MRIVSYNILNSDYGRLNALAEVIGHAKLDVTARGICAESVPTARADQSGRAKKDGGQFPRGAEIGLGR